MNRPYVSNIVMAGISATCPAVSFSAVSFSFVSDRKANVEP